VFPEWNNDYPQQVTVKAIKRMNTKENLQKAYKSQKNLKPKPTQSYDAACFDDLPFHMFQSND